MKFKDLLSIFFFGSLGSLSRYGLTLLFPGKQTTLLINIIGCFLLSFLTYYVIEHNLLSGWMNAGIGTGFIGAFTTFSSFCILIRLYSLIICCRPAFIYFFQFSADTWQHGWVSL